MKGYLFDGKDIQFLNEEIDYERLMTYGFSCTVIQQLLSTKMKCSKDHRNGTASLTFFHSLEIPFHYF